VDIAKIYEIFKNEDKFDLIKTELKDIEKEIGLLDLFNEI
jgi:hypothetical protein